jgi:N-acetylmuramic acid 6-phosphate etherase
VAALAPVVFIAARSGDRLARSVVRRLAGRLADDAEACALRLVQGAEPVEFVLAGGLLLHQAAFAESLARDLRRRRRHSRVSRLARESAWGAVAMAAHAHESRRPSNAIPKRGPVPRVSPPGWMPEATAISPTERRNPRSTRLERMTIAQGVNLMITEEASVAKALRSERGAIGKLVGAVANSFKRGGRLFYVGAGTSGRLGVLDASECPPTFRTAPDLVQGIIAGGMAALVSAVEGAEDDVAAGAQAILFRGAQRGDLVVGIAASGRTPFVWGALKAAHRRGATTALLCCNPHLRFARGQRPDHVVALDVGPEILTGSTRLKAGTATKLALNMITTLAMVRLGKVISNLMIDLNPSNTKLRDRAVRIVAELTRAGEPAAKEALAANGWSVRSAVQRLHRRRGNRRPAGAAARL